LVAKQAFLFIDDEVGHNDKATNSKAPRWRATLSTNACLQWFANYNFNNKIWYKQICTFIRERKPLEFKDHNMLNCV
jgi:hypothetical protein